MFPRMWIPIFLLLAALVPNARAAANGAPVWTNFYNGPGNSNDYSVAIATGKGGKVFVTGFSYSSASSNDFATVAYSNDGVSLWTNRFSGPGIGDDRAQAIAVDGNENVIVTGSVRNSASNYDFATIKYSGTGVPLWTNYYDGLLANGDDVPFGLAVDGGGNVFVVGLTITQVSSGDFVMIKYSGTGMPVWTNYYNGPGNGPDQANALAVDSDGNLIVTGYASRTNRFPYNYDYVTIKYSSANAPLWTNYYNGPTDADDSAQAVTVDASGNVFVVGRSYTSTNFSSAEYALVAYTSTGTPLWTNRYSITGRFVGSHFGIVTDNGGKVFVTGSLGTMAYSGAGVLLWTNLYGDSAIAVDKNGNLFLTVAGTFGISGSGAPLWTNPIFIGTLEAIAVNESGSIFATGRSYSTNGNTDFLTIKYSAMLTMTQAAAEEGQYRFQFNADSNLTYAVEFRDAASATNWATLTNLPAQPAATNLTFTNAITSPARLYRVRTP